MKTVRAALALILPLVLVAACSSKGDPKAKFKIVGEQNGLCECVENAQCAEGEICFNGHCVPLPEVTQDVEGTDLGRVDAESDGGLKPGAFKSPCATNEECDSGICIEIAPGVLVCTQPCVDDCPDGWECRGTSQDDNVVQFYCLPKQDRLCQPCKTDVSCTGTKNLCIEIGGLNNCGRDCAEVACPNGYVCQDVVSVEGVEGKQCVPANGQCQCTPETVGKQFQCEVENEHGSCPGLQVCQEDGSLTPCDGATAEPETCDGEDNDCDGFVDEGIEPVACSKENENGTCMGSQVCLPGLGETCKAAEPSPDICDTLDNDCDGSTDEDFRDEQGKYFQTENCGSCGVNCNGMFAHAVEIKCSMESELPVCAIAKCEPGYLLVSDTLCLPAIHHLCEPCVGDSACVGPADKCMAMSPVDTQTFCGRDCSADNQYGAGCPEGYSCKKVESGGEEFEQCVPLNGTCDCSELNAGLAKPCNVVNQNGTCFGVAVCDAALGWTGCTALTPQAEECDGKDNDCDGVIDEELSGNPCVVTNELGTCSGTEVCGGAQGLMCSAPSPQLDVCDGKDNDCDGAIDEDFATNVVDDAGDLVALVYDLSNEHCGACGIPCLAVPPAAKAECSADGLDALCMVVECQEGYYPSSANSCLHIPASNLCLPCQQDTDCLGPNDHCLSYPEGTFCGRDCSVGSIYGDADGPCSGEEGVQGCCPAGYLCTAGQCLRESLSCDCSADGKVKLCDNANAEGTCIGVRTCVVSGPDAGWQPCSAATPQPEVCDGKDNDCDGLFDMIDPSIDVAGLAGYPDCFNVSEACPGKWTCLQAGGKFEWVCSAPEPSNELCNGLDDDCDGAVDEDFKDEAGVFSLLGHCGQCGLDCASAVAHLAKGQDGSVLPGAVTCTAIGGQQGCRPKACEPGYYLFPTPEAATVCFQLEAASCQPCAQATDCPGAGHACASVGEDAGAYCLQRCDAGSPFPGCTGEEGKQGCCPAGFLCSEVGGMPQGQAYCLPVSGTCQCNGPNVGLQRPCTVSADGGLTTCFGIAECADKGGGDISWGPCDTSANVEVCDGKDNDCDGVADDGFKVNGKYAGDGNCGQCGKNCALKWSAQKQHATGKCDAMLPGGPDCVLGSCTFDLVGGGKLCLSDADCVGDTAGPTCLPQLFQCGRTCTGDAECAGGACIGGWCSPACVNTAACQAKFGAWSFCQQGHCVTKHQYFDLDGWTGNGCECPAMAGLTLDEPEVMLTYPLPGDSYVDRNCDGVDGDVATALFVAEGGAGDGSRWAPFGSIQKAIDAFKVGVHSHILVAAGAYEERLVLKNGVKIFGGYSDDFSTRDIVLLPTVVTGPAPDFGQGAVKPGTVYASAITQETVVAGLTILGYDVPPGGTSSGMASYAVFIEGSSSALRLQNNWLVGGQGGAGKPGGSGHSGTPGGSGAVGAASAECLPGPLCTGACNNLTCTGYLKAGGAGGTNTECAASVGCAGMEAEGGENPQVKDAPAPGCTYASGGQQATYGGGPANLCKYDCTVSTTMVGPGGGDGTSGAGGTGGSGCSSPFGTAAVGQWQAGSGAVGTAGGAGTGGQGGSAGSTVVNTKAGTCTVGNYAGDLGGSGGGGGAGGCGGSGGLNGQSGGASMVVFLASGAAGSFAKVTGNLVTRGLGGAGGSGGNGGSGGKGGSGGIGGTSGWPAWCAGTGGTGGRGGDGAPGGGGGGGCGGPSIGIAVVGGSTAAYLAENSFTLSDSTATGGPAGSGGMSAADNGAGKAGSQGGSQNVRGY